jgi:hypothetical protein
MAVYLLSPVVKAPRKSSHRLVPFRFGLQLARREVRRAWTTAVPRNQVHEEAGLFDNRGFGQPVFPTWIGQVRQVRQVRQARQATLGDDGGDARREDDDRILLMGWQMSKGLFGGSIRGLRLMGCFI